MTTQPEPEIILYDLACAKNTCFSPVVWRIRLMLNYKQIPYKTIVLEFPDIKPTLEELGMVPYESEPNSEKRYTVPAIIHLPSNTHLMDSVPISQFLNANYPEPPLPLKSDLGDEIEAKTRKNIGPTFRVSVQTREIRILSPRSQEYFRRIVGASLGRPFEDKLDADEEEQAWKAMHDGLNAAGEMMRTHKAEGPFVLGANPSYADFFIAASLQFARVVDEEVFQRFMVYPGFKHVYEACLPYMDKKN